MMTLPVNWGMALGGGGAGVGFGGDGALGKGGGGGGGVSFGTLGPGLVRSPLVWSPVLGQPPSCLSVVAEGTLSPFWEGSPAEGPPSWVLSRPVSPSGPAVSWALKSFQAMWGSFGPLFPSP